MKITQQQQNIIASLQCERLASNENNLRLIDSFYNSRNVNLTDALLNEAYQEDENGQIAYYLIKDSDDKILFYFSLKCGQLFDKFFNTKRFEELHKLYNSLLEKRNEKDISDADKKAIDSLLEAINTRKGFLKSDISKIARKNKTIEDFEKSIKDETEKVGATFAGVEIVHFCVNEENISIWESYNLPQKIGVVVFWYFIVPIVLKVKELIGCQYIYLFAADYSEDENLINYYKNLLRFEESSDRSTTMPLYDLTCKFLHQDTVSLNNKQCDFYDTFNPDSDAV